MTALSESKILTGSFTREAFGAHLERVKHLPAWWLDRKRVAYERFAALPMPKRTNEGWRFSNFAALTLDGFSPSVATSASAPADQSPAASSLSFLNNQLTARQPLH